MQEIHNLELTALIDMLSHYTAKYTRMLSEGAPKSESGNCREIIQILQEEIEARKNPVSGGNASNYQSPSL